MDNSYKNSDVHILFVYSSSFRRMTNRAQIDHNDKSVDGVHGTRTRGVRILPLQYSLLYYLIQLVFLFSLSPFSLFLCSTNIRLSCRFMIDDFNSVYHSIISIISLK